MKTQTDNSNIVDISDKEFWRDVKGYKGRYKISRNGDIYGFFRNKLLKPRINQGGYRVISLLTKEMKLKNQSIHQLVAIAFIKNPLKKRYVNHKDGNKLNNSVENLEWVTASENYIHALETGLLILPEGEKSYQSKLSHAILDVVFQYKAKSSLTYAEIAAKIYTQFNVKVHPSAIGCAVRGETWKCHPKANNIQ